MQHRYSKRFDSESRRWLVVDAFLFYKVVSNHASEAEASDEVCSRHETWKRYANAAGHIQQPHDISSRATGFGAGQFHN